LIEAEIFEINEVTAYLSSRLGPLPSSIDVEVYDSDTDRSDYNPDKRVKFAEDDEFSTPSDSSSDETDDEEMNDID
jgi:hypothetical protein